MLHAGGRSEVEVLGFHPQVLILVVAQFFHGDGNVLDNPVYGITCKSCGDVADVVCVVCLVSNGLFLSFVLLLGGLSTCRLVVLAALLLGDLANQVEFVVEAL